LMVQDVRLCPCKFWFASPPILLSSGQPEIESDIRVIAAGCEGKFTADLTRPLDNTNHSIPFTSTDVVFTDISSLFCNHIESFHLSYHDLQ